MSINEFLGFSYVEKIGKTAIGVIGFRNYECSLNDPNPIIHYTDCIGLENQNRKFVYYTTGMAMGLDGLKAAKEKLRPCTHNQIYLQYIHSPK